MLFSAQAERIALHATLEAHGGVGPDEDDSVPVRCELGPLEERAIHDQDRVTLHLPDRRIDRLVLSEIERFRPDQPIATACQWIEQKRDDGFMVPRVTVVALR